MYFMRIILFLLCLFGLSCRQGAYAQIDTSSTENLYKPTLDELNKAERVDRSEASVSVAGFTTTTLRESPGIVSLITAEDIQRMGARDLADVLRLVPGFDLATDVVPVLTIRGNGVNEGKVLVLIDGHAVNNISSGYAYIFQRFPLANIERIEIIRGAGSAIYGGLAGLAVINIQTKKATTNKQETHVSTLLGVTATGIFQAKAEVYSLNKFKNGVDLNVAASYNQTQLSDIDADSPVYFRRIENSKYSLIESSNLNLGMRYKKLDIRFLQSNMQSIHPEFDNTKFYNNYSAIALRYVFNINEKISVHTKASWNNQSAFFTDLPKIPPVFRLTGVLTSIEKLNLLDVRYLLNAFVVYQPIQNITLSTGVESHQDRSRYFNNLTFKNGSRVLSYMNVGVFAEANLTSKFVNITAGMRMDRYANIKPVAVPRIALTKAFKHMHFKALYTEAFKTPTIGNIENTEIGKDIVAERFKLIEFELGAKINKNLQFNINAYDIAIRNFITRTENSTADFFFANGANNGTQGVEGEARYQSNKLSVQIGYSFYRLAPGTISFLTTLPTVNPGTPAQKATLIANYEVNKRLHVNLTLMHISNKFLASNLSPNIIREFRNEQHLSLYAQYQDFLIKNMTISVGAYNLLNQTHALVSWNKNLLSEVHTTLQKREILLKITYQIKN